MRTHFFYVDFFTIFFIFYISEYLFYHIFECDDTNSSTMFIDDSSDVTVGALKCDEDIIEHLGKGYIDDLIELHLSEFHTVISAGTLSECITKRNDIFYVIGIMTSHWEP